MSGSSHALRKDSLAWARWCLWTAWVCGAASVSLAWLQARYYVFHPQYLPLTIFFVGVAFSTIAAIGFTLWRTIRGPDRLRAAFILVAVLPPAGLWGYVGLTASSNWKNRLVPDTGAMRLAKVMGATFMRLEADVEYLRRLESDRIVMYYDSRHPKYVEQVDRPEDDLAAMDRHLMRLEDLLGERIAGKVFWVRGPLLGSEHLSLHGLALGSAWSPEILGSYRGDRHELAHAALDWFRTPASNPPYVLHEGWAMAQCGDSRFELAQAAAKAREENPQLRLRDLFGPSWYYRDSGPVYSIGGAFVEFLVRTFSGQSFRRFYVECTPANAGAKCLEIFGVELDVLEVKFWADVNGSLQK